MKNLLVIISLLISSNLMACGGGYDGEYSYFYNLFRQTNISSEEFYPFLRDEYNNFYGNRAYYEGKEETIVYPKGNVDLWMSILDNWSREDIEKAVYTVGFNWNNKNTKNEQQAKIYIQFAQDCSAIFSHRYNRNSWDYNEVIDKVEIDTQALLARASLLLSKTTNKQIQARYYYQIIRIMHYSEEWSEAIRFFKSKVENKLEKNEIYYYILDQVAGCYYSTGDYERAAYLFTKTLNKSIDRKKSAFLSYNFCTLKNAEGKPFFKGIDDEKDLLLISSLRNFSDEINNIKKFIELDANDNRVELLFMRALSNVERNVWEIDPYDKLKELPYLKANKNHQYLLKIATQQIANAKVSNKDFWRISSSYLSFINQDIAKAKSFLKTVNAYTYQKKILSVAYEVFSWKNITAKNENYINAVLLDPSLLKNTSFWENQSDWRLLVLDKIAHTYYKNNKIAHAFLVHNSVLNTNNLQSLALLNQLEIFYNKANKSDFEKMLLQKSSLEDGNFLDYINFQKGIYYLYDKNPKLALTFFSKDISYEEAEISARIFSNNIKECFECPEEDVMLDEVYKSSVFSFINEYFSRKELAQNLVKLEQLTQDKKQWKAKLANYLLGNYYYNISNTGYYRGTLTENTNCCEYTYLGWYGQDEIKDADQIIKNKEGYNLSNIIGYNKYYFGMSKAALDYYQKTIDLSSDKELNARCLYLMAKCELNDFYNLGSTDTFEIKEEYGNIELPNYQSFKTLKKTYSDTEFHSMILKECSYYKAYSASY